MKTISKALGLIAVCSLSVLGQTVDPCTQNTKLSGGTNLQMNGNQGTGTLSGTDYHYEIWVDQGGASGAKLTWYGANQGGGAAFRAEWTNPDDYLGRIGYYWGNGGAYTQYKNIYSDFNYTRSGRSTAGDYSYIGIYGWTRNPLVEFYVVEDWFGNQWQADNTPITTNTTGGSVVGSFTVDGGTYDIIKSERVQKPSIDGTQTFTQVFSVRKTPRKCGTISVTEHFKKWKELNLPFGNNMYEAKFLAEAGGGTGWLELSYLKFSQEEQPRGSTPAVSSSSVVPSSSSITPSSSSVAPSSSSVVRSSSSAATSSSSVASSSSAATSSSSVRSSSSVAPSSSSAVRSSSSVAPSSSSAVRSSSSVAPSSNSESETSSSSGEVSPIAHNPLPAVNSEIPAYYNIKGEPVGSTKPATPGVYLVKQGSSVQKIVVR